MAKRKTKAKGSLPRHVINKALSGFHMHWSMVDPLGDHDKPLTVRVGHSNPVMSLRLQQDGFWNLVRQVLHYRRLKWRITVKMEFVDNFGTPYVRESELVAVGSLPDVDDDYQAMLEQMFSEANMSHYRTTHIRQEVLKGELIQDGDFTEVEGVA